MFRRWRRTTGPQNEITAGGTSGRAPFAIFPVTQYLSDSALRAVAVGLARRMMRTGQTDVRALLPFHPLSLEILKQNEGADVYCLTEIHGKLVRVHVVATNGVSCMNPPPDDSLCDSCHLKGWLKKEFQDSKIDGANIPVWLCPACSKMRPEERDVRF